MTGTSGTINPAYRVLRSDLVSKCRELLLEASVHGDFTRCGRTSPRCPSDYIEPGEARNGSSDGGAPHVSPLASRLLPRVRLGRGCLPQEPPTENC